VLIALGVVLFMYAMWRLGHMTTASGEADARVALLVRGAALGLLFVPINQVAFGSLDPKIAQQAAGLINLARQLGGSFGIAILTTFVTTHVQYHRVNLIQHLYAYNPELLSREHMLAANLMAHGATALQAQAAAIGQVDQLLMRQATMLAYNDAWLLILIVFCCCSPAVLLLRKPKARAGAAVDAH
jgi:MFS transporter, DHA2 family, multidrug resistance protein